MQVSRSALAGVGLTKQCEETVLEQHRKALLLLVHVATQYKTEVFRPCCK